MNERALAVIEQHAGYAPDLEAPVEGLGMDSLEFLDLLIDLDISIDRSLDLKTVADLMREAK